MDRKKDHIELALKSQVSAIDKDGRFIYEPMLQAHPTGQKQTFTFLKKQIATPIWASSMTGGTEYARIINENIARVCKDYKMGMGLGSCRIILDDNTCFDDFNVRQYIGYDLPLYANLGIAQLEQLLFAGKTDILKNLVDKLQADGLIIHVNPLQEFFQPEGNTIKNAPIESIEKLLDKVNFPIIVKEVGQGIGKESLKKLLELPLEAIEFGAFGGTNFSMLEMQRAEKAIHDIYNPLAYIGQTAEQMVNDINEIVKESSVRCEQIIISGGIKTFLDGYYLTEKSTLNAIYGMASTILTYAKHGYDELHKFVGAQKKGLAIAKAYLKVNPD